jgi:hypothetical protein
VGLLDMLRGGRRKDLFAKAVIARLTQRGWGERPRYNRSDFSINLGPHGGFLHLENLYRDWLTYPELTREEALDLAIDLVFDPPRPATYEEAAALLLPIIRNRAQLHNGAYSSNPGSGQPFERPPMQPLAGPLAILAALDQPHSIAVVMASDLAAWNTSFEDVLARAVENLRAQAGFAFERDEAGFYVSDFGDYYDASRLLLPELFTALPLDGAPIAVAVSRSLLLVAGSKDTPALDAMAEVAEAEVADDTRAVAYQPLMLSEGGWRDLEPPLAQRPSLSRLTGLQQAWDNSAQKGLLDLAYASEEPPAYISALDLTTHAGRTHTWCLWSEGDSVLLPRSDLVGLLGADKQALGVRWESLEAVLGPLRPEENSYPPLVRPRAWPDAAQWRALAREAQELGWAPAGR